MLSPCMETSSRITQKCQTHNRYCTARWRSEHGCGQKHTKTTCHRPNSHIHCCKQHARIAQQAWPTTGGHWETSARSPQGDSWWSPYHYISCFALCFLTACYQIWCIKQKFRAAQDLLRKTTWVRESSGPWKGFSSRSISAFYCDCVLRSLHSYCKFRLLQPSRIVALVTDLGISTRTKRDLDLLAGRFTKETQLAIACSPPPAKLAAGMMQSVRTLNSI